jgi:hypothetical protein
MSHAIDFLGDYFESKPGEPGTRNTKADFAKAAGIDPSLVTQILQSTVQLSSKNVQKLLLGFRSDQERREFLTAYLRDQVPPYLADDVHITIAHHAVSESSDSDAAQMEISLIAAFNDLTRKSDRLLAVRFLQQIRTDGDLRDLFRRAMRYIDDLTDPKAEARKLADEEHRRRGEGGRDPNTRGGGR